MIASTNDLTTLINVVVITLAVIIVPPIGFFIKSFLNASREAAKNQAQAATTLAQLTERVAGLQKKSEEHDTEIRDLWRRRSS